MDVTERPIHCSDQKRLQFYVKNDDEWTRDSNNEKIDSSIEKISKKQIETIKKWTEQNPDFMDCDQKRDEYFKLVTETMKPNDDKNLRNIKKKVGENVKLDK
jgi:flagellar motility protein MotE (MotC chaperone)